MNRLAGSTWPLIAFTLLTQMVVGTFVLWGIATIFLPTLNPYSEGQYSEILLTALLLVLIIGALAATFHLGRPLAAVFSLTNLNNSWLSRETIMSVGFGLMILILLVLRWRGIDFNLLTHTVILLGIVCGLGLVYGIARLYRLRTVPAWNHLGTPATFYTTSLLLGMVMLIMLLSLMLSRGDSVSNNLFVKRIMEVSPNLIALLVGIQAGIFGFVIFYLNNQGGAAADSVRILWTKLRGVLIWRWLTAGLGVAILIFGFHQVFIYLAFALLLISEVLGRYLFYGFYQRTGY
jgi:anaerobic dimethyl sulfoxide reductase subunit C (anchor subunit)